MKTSDYICWFSIILFFFIMTWLNKGFSYKYTEEKLNTIEQKIDSLNKSLNWFE
jgi:hypothetical protein